MKQAKNKHILFICRFLPYAEARDSGRTDTYHYIKSLSRLYSVSVIAFVKEEEMEHVSLLEDICKYVVVVPFEETSLKGRVWRLICRQLFTKIYGRVFSLQYKKQLQTLITQHNFDLAIIDGMMAIYSQYLIDIPTVLDEVDIFSNIAYQLYQQQINSLGSFHTWQDWLRTVNREHIFIKEANAILVRSDKDEQIIYDLHPTKPIHIVRPWFEGLDQLKNIPIERPPNNNILFMGAMNIYSNIQAASFFATEVFPIIQQQIPDARFYIVGHKPTVEVRTLALQNDEIIVTGEVLDLLPYYRKTAINVIPLFIGGGVIVKTLNGLASGRPTVATKTGNSGTGAKPKQDIVITPPDPQRMAHQIIAILHDDKHWYDLARKGREFIMKNYHWGDNIEDLSCFLQKRMFVQKKTSL